jgi:prepilin-type N-terminal cleavage/methylation domain-containing protein
VGERVLREESGFTLPEMLVTMMVMILVFFALYSIFDMGLRGCVRR